MSDFEHEYEVVAGSVGTVYRGCGFETSESDARHTFKLYKLRSVNGEGRGAHEDVTLFRDGEPLVEYSAPRCDECGEYLYEEKGTVTDHMSYLTVQCGACYTGREARKAK